MATTTATSSVRPWLTSFLSLSSISLPPSLPDLSLRFHNNLHTFRANYVIISLIIFILTLILHPVKAVIFIILISTWIYFIGYRDEPLVVFDIEISDRTVVIVLSVVTVAAVAVARVWWNVFVSVLVSALVVSLHAIVMAPDGGESPYGSLLSGGDEDGGARGGYVPV
ncbi:PRA1 family protein D-like [Bidens hawaiensis]|uniref:PRA1 family protein D-like n=1 Tax=Bidens hawaiensis TaxID=980011 RepID=UPI00404AB8D7